MTHPLDGLPTYPKTTRIAPQRIDPKIWGPPIDTNQAPEDFAREVEQRAARASGAVDFHYPTDTGCERTDLENEILNLRKERLQLAGMNERLREGLREIGKLVIEALDAKAS